MGYSLMWLTVLFVFLPLGILSKEQFLSLGNKGSDSGLSYWFSWQFIITLITFFVFVYLTYLITNKVLNIIKKLIK